MGGWPPCLEPQKLEPRGQACAEPSLQAGRGRTQVAATQPCPTRPPQPVLHFLLAGSKLLIAALSCLEIGGNYNSKRLNKPLQRLELAPGTLPDGPVVNESLLKGQ